MDHDIDPLEVQASPKVSFGDAWRFIINVGVVD
jgi:hypothetical protein